MALTLTPSPYQTVLDSDGDPVSGAKVNTYLAGTTTAASTYTTSVGDVANANPIVADSAGRFVAYLSAGLSYKFVITTSADVAVDEQDNVLAVPGSSVNLDITGTAGIAIAAGEVCFISATGDAAGTAGLWYLADADLAYSSTTAVEIGIAVSAIAINTSGTIRIAGEATTATSTVVGTKYYCSATAGAITSSAPALARLVGIAPTTSSLILNANTLTIPVPVSQGGTGKTTLTAYGVLLGGTSTTGAVQPLTPAAAGQLLKSGGTGAVAAWTDDPSVATLTLSTPLAVASGGTGLDTLTANGILLGAGTSDVTLLAPSTSGNVATSNGTLWQSTAPAAGGFSPLNLVEGRLTLTSATPVTTANVTSTTLYWALYRGNRIALYTGSEWSMETIAELSISVPSTTDTMYDAFIDYNGGTPALAVTAWSSDTARATSLTTQNGVLVQTGNTDWRYVGSFRTTSVSGQAADSLTYRGVWNYYNRVPRVLRRLESTSSWTYTTETWRQADGDTANQIEVVVGVAEVPITVNVYALKRNTTINVWSSVGVGEDSTSAAATGTIYVGGGSHSTSASAGGTSNVSASLKTFPAIGHHVYAWLEISAATGTTTWYGVSASVVQAGIEGEIEG
jgi:hypothetical protein